LWRSDVNADSNGPQEPFWENGARLIQLIGGLTRFAIDSLPTSTTKCPWTPRPKLAVRMQAPEDGKDTTL